MTPLFKKLNLGRHAAISVLDAPASFEPELEALEGVAVSRSTSCDWSFAIAFVVTAAERDAASARLVAASGDDGVLWMAYPKASSRRYRCEFNRDCGWPVLAAAGYEPVRIVAIDEDWSALRFRKVEHVRASAGTSARRALRTQPPDVPSDEAATMSKLGLVALFATLAIAIAPGRAHAEEVPASPVPTIKGPTVRALCPNVIDVLTRSTYPHEAIARNLRVGEAVIDFVVDGGRAEQVSVFSESDPVFGEAATAVISKLACLPVEQPVRMRVPFTFKRG